MYIRLSHHAPSVARLPFRTMGVAAKCAPRLYGWLAARELGSADATVLRADGFATFAHMSQEALRQPQGCRRGVSGHDAPWGFAPEDIAVPTDIWAGADDELLDPSWPGELGRRTPGATLHLRPGGHFLAHLYYREIFESLRGY